MLLRFAKPSDLSEISRIYAASWKQAYRGMVPQAYLDRLPEDFWVPSFSQRLEQGNLHHDSGRAPGGPAGLRDLRALTRRGP